MATVKKRLSRCLSVRGNVENLLILATVTAIEIAISLEAPYYLLAIIVTVVIFLKEATLIALFAEEIEREVRTIGREIAADVARVEGRAETEVAE